MRRDPAGEGRLTETDLYEAERPRLVRLAARVLGDDAEAEDIVQQAWLRLQGTDQEIENLPGWLTTVTTRLCLDRLRAKVPVPAEQDVEVAGARRATRRTRWRSPTPSAWRCRSCWTG